MADVEARRIEHEGLGIHVVEAGPVDGDAVLLIHGWPDSWHLWRHQIAALAGAGYRVLAYDQRGFGASDRPAALEGYGLGHLLADATAVLDDAGVAQAHVVGHDWGAPVAWLAAAAVPDRVRTCTALSVGHPNAFRDAGMAQRERSWYMLLFQFEGVAEEWLSANDWENLRTWAHDPADLDRYVADLSRPGALSASLSVYRANVPPESLNGPALPLPAITCPTLGVIGTEDFALGVDQMSGSGEYVTGEWHCEVLDGVDHWIPVDVPERCNELLLDWFARH